MRWELKTIHGPREGSALDAVPLGLHLAELLDQGWEPFGVVDRGEETWVFLKRPTTGGDIRLTGGATKERMQEFLESRQRDKAFLRSRRRQKKTARAKAAKGKTR